MIILAYYAIGATTLAIWSAKFLLRDLPAAERLRVSKIDHWSHLVERRIHRELHPPSPEELEAQRRHLQSLSNAAHSGNALMGPMYGGAYLQNSLNAYGVQQRHQQAMLGDYYNAFGGLFG